MNIQEQVQQALKFSHFGMAVLGWTIAGCQTRSFRLIDNSMTSVEKVQGLVSQGGELQKIIPIPLDSLENQLITALLEMYESPEDQDTMANLQAVIGKMHQRYPDGGRNMRHLFQQVFAYGYNRTFG